MNGAFRANRLFVIKFLGLFGASQEKATRAEDVKNINRLSRETGDSEPIVVSTNNHVRNSDINPLLSGGSKYKNAIEASNERIVDKILQSGGPGLTIAVSRGGKTVWKAGYGFCDIENQLTCHPDAHMRIASISKMIFASTVVAPMLESKQINLDDSIYKFLTEEEFPRPKYEGHKVDITLKQLLSHTSGVRHYAPDWPKTMQPIGSAGSMKIFQDDQQLNSVEYYNRKNYRSVIEALEPFRGDNAVDSKPGEFKYTTYGYTLLSAAIEKVLQKAEEEERKSKAHSDNNNNKLSKEGDEFKKIQVEDFWIKTLRTKWDMKETFLDQDEVIIPKRARYYARSSYVGNLHNVAYSSSSVKWAGGGLNSTAGDLLKFGNRLIDSYKGRPGAPLKRETIDTLWTVVQKNYALGAFVHQPDPNNSDKKTLCVQHSGSALGCSSMLLIHPETETVVAILINISNISLLDLAEFIANQFDMVA